MLSLCKKDRPGAVVEAKMKGKGSCVTVRHHVLLPLFCNCGCLLYFLRQACRLRLAHATHSPREDTVSPKEFRVKLPGHRAEDRPARRWRAVGAGCGAFSVTGVEEEEEEEEEEERRYLQLETCGRGGGGGGALFAIRNTRTFIDVGPPQAIKNSRGHWRSCACLV